MPRDPTDLRAQEAERHERSEAERIALARQEADFRWLMRQAPFRRFVWRYLGEAGVFRSTFNDNAARAAFGEGRRDMGLFLQSEIQALAPEGYELMLKERREKREMKKT